MADNIPLPAAEEEELQTCRHSSPCALTSKWFGFVSAIWVQAISGNNYTFANYSVELKAILGINQVRLNGLSSAKDVGKAFGVVAGFLSDYLPPWTILLIGSLEGMLGYGAQWLVISRKIRPLPYWMMCIVLCMGGNSTTWMNTAVLVTCVRNFRRNRGPVSGILKAYVGLSTAIFTDLCTALFGGDAAAFVLMLALIPLGVCAVAIFLLKPVECELDMVGESNESHCFSVLNSVAIVLALYLLAYDLSGIKKVLLSKLIAVGLCIILVAPAALPIYLHFKVMRRKRQTTLNELWLKQNGKDLEQMNAVEHRGAERMTTTAGEEMVHRDVEVSKTLEEVMANRDVEEVSTTECEAMGHRESEEELTAERGEMAHGDVAELPNREGKATVDKDVEGVSTMEGETMGHREAGMVSTSQREVPIHRGTQNSTPEGEVMVHRDRERVLNTTIHRDARVSLREGEGIIHRDVEKVSTTLEGCPGGVNAHSYEKKIGLAVINNTGQIGQALGYSSVSIFVSLISIWGFFGRLGSGVLSEYLIRWKAVPRPVLLAASQLVMVLGYLILAAAMAGSLYIGSIVVGVCYGVRLSVSVPVTSEMFGLKKFGLMYNLLIINLPVGSLLFSSFLAGFLYDCEAVKDGSTTTCLGAHCYRLVFLLMAAMSGMGFVLDCILTLRTRSLYQQIYRTKHCKG
ncbi:hypothetical protein GOP47_0018053 [Adiantum capillus-veneris]|uniref:Nodulin-like domain-containing protein n=1 Tax=Adiantum capillus-veneris TaxID=13818 RepID=A0A9D4ZBG6_ADICA|nr:hypothetical protein GOP47_0018053 [Adiantum capillus-veneris]